VLLILIIPLFSMRLAFTDAGNDPPGLTTRQAFDLLAQGFGPGFNGPLVLAAEVPAGSGQAAVAKVDDALRQTPGWHSSRRPVRHGRRHGGDHRVSDHVAPVRPDRDLVHRLRSQVLPAATAGTGVKVLVGGETAASVDASSYLSSRLFLVIGVVLVLSFILLMAAFRSLAIPLKAAVVNLLSVGAAYGVIVAVFQWGWLGGVIGIGATGPIDPWIPLMMFTILFGLSMDYEVFLLSRMREEWRRSTTTPRRWPTVWPRPRA